MPQTRGHVLIGQAGGPTAVINQSLVGVIETALDHRSVGGVIGSLHGIQGVLKGELVDLSKERRKTLESVARTPGSALRSVRKKPTQDECQQILNRLKQLDVRWFFYIGGNDSAETALLLSTMAADARQDLVVMHVPKTIDNDLMVTDHCPGYPSAARFVALAHLGDDMDSRSLLGVKVNVLMGRHAGWLTASSALARVREDDGPHLIYCPEQEFSMDAFCADVDRVMQRLGRCVVAVSEGIHDKAGNLIGASGERDSHGNQQLSGSGHLGDLLVAALKSKLGSKLRARADTLGYLQRSFAGVVSEVDAKEARKAGRFAAAKALAGAGSHSVSIVRKPKKHYRADFRLSALEKVAKDQRRMDPAFLRGTNDVSPEFVEWLRPLVGKLPRMGHLAEVRYEVHG
jgi:6-phosphofructokinase 1